MSILVTFQDERESFDEIRYMLYKIACCMRKIIRTFMHILQTNSFFKQTFRGMARFGFGT